MSIYVDVDMGVGEGTKGAEVGDGEGGDGAELSECYQFLGKGVQYAEGDEGLEGGEGIEVGDGEGAGVGEGEGVAISEGAGVGEGEGDEKLVDSDFEMEEVNEEDDVYRPQAPVWGECSESSEFENEETDVDNDGDLNEHRDSNGEGTGPSYPVFNPEETYDPTFELGMMFSNKAEFKKALQSYAIKTKRTLKFIKNDKVRVYANCGNPDCEWTMHAIKKFKSDPKRCVKGFRVDIINVLRVNVSRHQAYRARTSALKELEGSSEWQYSKFCVQRNFYLVTSVTGCQEKEESNTKNSNGKLNMNQQETEGATILPPLPPEEDPMDEPTVDPCITQQKYQVAAAPVYKKGPSMYQQLQQSNQHLTLQPRVQIRAPPPMIGSQRLPVFSNTSRAPQGNRTAIIRDGGQKFLDLSQISSLG
ncbi:UNVERIFIED_CONTAM: hypothetical protein Sindi_1252800 [Sesamum indicum]